MWPQTLWVVEQTWQPNSMREGELTLTVEEVSPRAVRMRIHGSVLLTANRVLFDALHVLGAVVLVALGAQAWRSARSRADEGFGAALTARLPRGRTPGSAFRASLISIAANPKAAVFAITFLPQFLPRHGPVFPTVVVLATIQVIVDTAWCAGLVLLAERASDWLGRGAIRQRMERALGAILVALGVDLAAQTR